MKSVDVIENSMVLNASSIHQQLKNTEDELNVLRQHEKETPEHEEPKIQSKSETDPNMKFLKSIFEKMNLVSDNNRADTLRHLDEVVLLGGAENMGDMNVSHQAFLANFKYRAEERENGLLLARKSFQSDMDKNQAALEQMRKDATLKYNEILTQAEKDTRPTRRKEFRSRSNKKEFDDLMCQIDEADKLSTEQLVKDRNSHELQVQKAYHRNEKALLAELENSSTVLTDRSTAQLINYLYKFKKETIEPGVTTSS